MFSIANKVEPAPAPAKPAGRRMLIAQIVTVALVTLLTLAAFLTLDRAIAVEHEWMAAIAHVEHVDATAQHAARGRIDGELTLLHTVGLAICSSVLVTLLLASIAVFGPMARRLARLSNDALELARVATTDPLTGMLNRRSFQARGAIEIQKARRYGRPLSMLMIDADQLSAIEGAHGPSGGQTVLKALTSSFFAGTRVSDLLARVDAEQFAILLPETDCSGAELLAERLRTKIGNLTVPINDKFVTCTLSIGVAAAEKDASFLWPTFKRADEALYEAKIRGRNRVVVAAAA